MEQHAPVVSVGLPVYNGEDYVAEAIESILQQTLNRFELIISDNASTDNTGETCLKYAAKDPRVRYFRQQENIGGANNFNYVFLLARAPYFKWLAHDDVCRPLFLERCVEVLDRDPGVVLAYPRGRDIDATGGLLGLRDVGLAIDSDDPYRRFRGLLTQGHAGLPQFGVARTAVMKRTALLGTYEGSDRPYLNELSLHGRFHEVPEELFLHREHAGRSVYVHCTGEGMLAWWNPSKVGSVPFPLWQRLEGYVGGLWRSPVTVGTKLRCGVLLLRWMKGMRSGLWREFAHGSAAIILRGGERLRGKGIVRRRRPRRERRGGRPIIPMDTSR